MWPQVCSTRVPCTQSPSNKCPTPMPHDVGWRREILPSERWVTADLNVVTATSVEAHLQRSTPAVATITALSTSVRWTSGITVMLLGKQ